MSKLHIAALALMALTACSAPAATESDAARDAAEAAADADAANDDTATPSAPAAPVSAWSYDEDRDEMRETSTKFASISSSNEVGVTWPYTPGPARMTLRQRSTDGLSVMVNIEGQFTCRSYQGDTIAVKFDDGPIQQYRCNEPEGGAPGLLFIQPERRFVTALKAAERVVLELPVYEAGPQQMVFHVEGLVWE
ncbi:MAG: hypothetical protein JHC81_03690 [Brevundimonas sp.]|uniref:hypothetical protein n=1 Tax=Brevundimonas sp. TaxID=1871086 RepID=UPI001A20ED4F|nr:hypothetical protein [Brevundimonas sp.]MBJ7446615.1 hypothetical protein [Brevundimonas sp.]